MAASGGSIHPPHPCAVPFSRHRHASIAHPRPAILHPLGPQSLLPAKSYDIQSVARLARLELSADEEQQYGRELGSVLDFVEALKRVDVEGVEPTAHTADLTNVFRADEPRPGLGAAAALANAPRAANGLFLVPKVIEG